MKVLITGANGFIGKNLHHHLAERQDVEVVCFTRKNTLAELPLLLVGVDFVFHLAGVNRPRLPQEFTVVNVDLTFALLEAIEAEMSTHGRLISIVYTSSTQAVRDNPYGVSKLQAEDQIRSFARRTGAAIHVFRLPNVFGKWCRPNYNSVVATFCNNIARSIPLHINDPTSSLTLVYIDDVVERFIHLMDCAASAIDAEGFATVFPQYTTTVGQLALQIKNFHASRHTLLSDRVGTGFLRALYATYVSYLPPESFAYSVPMHSDTRGVFVEMLKTPDCGQFSFFTAHPGITRGGHYHHSKTEKFLVITGVARFTFRHIHTGELYELVTSGAKAEIVQSAPGWTHDITNIGSDEMVVMLWSNEVFNPSQPDTYAVPFN